VITVFNTCAPLSDNEPNLIYLILLQYHFTDNEAGVILVI
jgi:hypothetical protein